MNKFIEQVGSQRFYPLENGEYNPSVTTILGACYPTSPFLVEWIAGQGIEKANQIKMEAAEEGRIIHELCERVAHGDKIRADGLSSKQRKCLNAFTKWWTDVKPKLIATELRVDSMEHRYSGTIDLICEIDGEPWIVDLKSSNSLHAEYDAQVGAYAEAYSPYMRETGQLKAGILHLNSKTRKGYSWHVVDVEKGWAVFKTVRDLFYLLNPDPKPKFIEYPEFFTI